MDLAAIIRFFIQGFIAFILPIFVLNTHAAEAASSLEGTWAQRQSDAGECATCEVLVEPVFGREGLLLVTSNYGWTAQIFFDRNASHVAGGVGRWNTGNEHIYSGRIFDLGMEYSPAGMEMRMRWKDGSTSNWMMTSFKRTELQAGPAPNINATRFPSVADQTDLEPLSAQYDFTCDSGKMLSVVYDQRAAESIALATYDDGRTSFLIQVISGSGTRFANDEYTLHTKGKSAVFTKNDQTYVCELK